jgi:hypothetical protein
MQKTCRTDERGRIGAGRLNDLRTSGRDTGLHVLEQIRHILEVAVSRRIMMTAMRGLGFRKG